MAEARRLLALSALQRFPDPTTMLKTRSPLPCALLLCCIGGGMSAWAEPTTPSQQDFDGETAVAPAAVNRDAVQNNGGMVDPSAAAGVPNASNTIKMLLELQAAPEPGASASESGRPSTTRPTGTQPKTQTPAANPFGKGDNPFGASPEFVRPAAAPGASRAGVDWQMAPAGSTFTGGFGSATGVISVTRDPHEFAARRPAGSSGSDAAEQRWWMPSALIRWVREHRQEVLIGAAVALGLAWAGSARAAKRRR